MHHLIKLVLSLAMLVSMQVYAGPVDINTAGASILAGAMRMDLLTVLTSYQM
jgi:hypothetical protein